MEYLGHRLRHELKFYINDGVYHTLRSRLATIASPDSHMHDPEGYLITSIYFDDFHHTAMEEKISGNQFRNKYRIRGYNRSDARILLECKRKYGEYISKDSAPLSRQEYDSILAGDYSFLVAKDEPLCQEFYARRRLQLIHPTVVVEYLREAYVAREGNVRITFDKDVSACSIPCSILLEPGQARRVLEPGQMVLEVKFDSYLPDAIAQILQTGMTERCAISKYVMCRNEKRRLLYR